jgi:hypothetical protein
VLNTGDEAGIQWWVVGAIIQEGVVHFLVEVNGT